MSIPGEGGGRGRAVSAEVGRRGPALLCPGPQPGRGAGATGTILTSHPVGSCPISSCPVGVGDTGEAGAARARALRSRSQLALLAGPRAALLLCGRLWPRWGEAAAGPRGVEAGEAARVTAPGSAVPGWEPGPEDPLGA